MAITGAMLIGSEEVLGTQGTVRAVNPATGAEMEPAFGGGTLADVDRACELAEESFDAFRTAPLETRAKLLETIASEIEALGDELIERAMAESGLPRPRLEGERGRTCGQLRMFAAVVRAGRWQRVTLDTPLPDRKPLPRSDLRSRHIPVGPVAVFGASNFPLAFSVAGGDTASALAAGCPVIAKAHPSHLGTSELAARAIAKAVAAVGLPAGIFSLLVGIGNEVGGALVKHPAIQSVAFTGSRRGGQALMALAAARPQPIPVFAEMSSINPVFLLPSALQTRGAAIATGLVGSATLGVGQFCTKPGLIFAIDGPEFQEFAKQAGEAISVAASATMLNSGIQEAFAHGVGQLCGLSGVKKLGVGAEQAHPIAAQPALFHTTATEFTSNPKMSEEIFGPVALLIACKDADEMVALAKTFEGQLTATMHLEAADTEIAKRLLPVLERKAGRILVNGFPTGVEVSYAMVHGGPAPATSDGRVTSVGAMSIDRFLRPVCYQDLPDALLPTELQNANLEKSVRLIDGKLSLAS